ncbi:MAG: VWA domain-containing protein [Planctomycetes bacterium]|nr:VWA domain-containing protein [Planctomycetota bacterium]
MNRAFRTFLSIAATAAITGNFFIGSISANPSYARLGTMADNPAPAEAKETPEAPKPPEKRTPKIQIAILLDTSGSMDGLIDQARSQLWRVVNTFAKAKQDGVAPVLEVALYEYGNDGIAAAEGHVRMVCALTTDLDKVSEQLFKLTTNGGEEYCGTVIQKAVNGLQWSTERDDYKAIFIAGNEPFTQGTVNYVDSCKLSIGKGIMVNTIHCGSEEEGIQGKWKDAALLADGSFMSINANAQVVSIASPYDDEIVKLSQQMNKTYIPYGKEGKDAANRQEEQDKNADAAGQGADVNRAASKASQNYRNDSWDLVDKIDIDKIKVEDIKKEDLPEELRKLSNEDLTKYIDKKREERNEIKKQLEELNKKRDSHVAEERKKMADKGEKTLDEAMVKTVKDQAAKKNIKTD